MTNPTNNTNQEQIKTYIQQQLRAGLTSNEIQQQLQAAGWQSVDIAAAFTSVQTAIAPSQSPAVPAMPTRGRFKTGWLLFKQSLSILKNNPKLYRYVVMSGIWTSLIAVVFVGIWLQWQSIFYVASSSLGSSDEGTLTPVAYAVLFVFYLLTFCIINFYTAAMAINLLDIFAGKDAGYKAYLAKARSRFKQLFIFSCIEATIGIASRAIENRAGGLGRLVAGLANIAWSIARLFVVPIIATTETNAIPAIKQSAQLVVATWGENLAGRVALSGALYIVYLLVVLPICLVIGFVFFASLGLIGLIIAAVIFVALGIAVSVVSSAADSILNVVLYYYATTKKIPAAFDGGLINSAFVAKKKKA